MAADEELLRRFRPERRAGPDNPLPRAIYDPTTGAFLGNTPTVVDRGPTPQLQRWQSLFKPPASLSPSEASQRQKINGRLYVHVDGRWIDHENPNAQVPEELQQITIQNHERESLPLLQRLGRDAAETIQDLREEPEEVPFRLKERLRSYLPLRKNPFERPK